MLFRGVSPAEFVARVFSDSIHGVCNLCYLVGFHQPSLWQGCLATAYSVFVIFVISWGFIEPSLWQGYLVTAHAVLSRGVSLAKFLARVFSDSILGIRNFCYLVGFYQSILWQGYLVTVYSVFVTFVISWGFTSQVCNEGVKWQHTRCL